MIPMKIRTIFLLVIVGLLSACQGGALQKTANEDLPSFVAGEATATLMDVLRSRQFFAAGRMRSCAAQYGTLDGEFIEEYLGDGVWLVKYGRNEWHVYEYKPIVLTKSALAGC